MPIAPPALLPPLAEVAEAEAAVLEAAAEGLMEGVIWPCISVNRLVNGKTKYGRHTS